MAKWLIVLVCFSVSSIADTPAIVYPWQQMGDEYPIELLKLALNKNPQKQEYQLRESPIQITQGRSLLLISQDREIDIAWSMTSNQRESILTAVKIPIYKGLFGYRLFLIHKEQQNQFPDTLSFEQLSKERLAIQGVDWPDISILRHNKLDVMSVKHFNAMFEMVTKQRVDYFPRSILEIWDEQHNFGKGELVVEQNLALFYPTYVYYFVSKNNPELAKTVEEGLLATIADGSFDALFNRYKGTSLEKAALKKRQIFHLENPNVNSDGVYQWPSISSE